MTTRGGRPASRAVAAASKLSERLLELALLELEHADRPLARLAARRCLDRLADLCEQVELLASSRDLRHDGGLLPRAAGALSGARWALRIVNRQGAILPTAYKNLAAGLDVVERRLQQLGGPRPSA